MSHIHDTLFAIHQQVELIRPRLLKILQPGLSRSVVINSLTSRSITCPEAVVDIYEWKNGTIEGQQSFGEMWLFPNWFFVSLEHSLEIYDGLVADLPDVWMSNWYPFGRSGCGDYIGVESDSMNNVDGQVVAWDSGDFEARIEYVSIASMLTTILMAYQTGAIDCDQGGKIRVDYDRYQSIAARCNPGLGRWN